MEELENAQDDTWDYQPATIMTFTGRLFAPLNPDPGLINIADIAHSLSMKVRFSGHTQKFYSVAQHSVLVSLVCNQEDALWGLLHDASEAYLVDMPKPLKVLPEFQWFVAIENKVQAAVAAAFGLSQEQPESVHFADKRLLMTEKRDVMNNMRAGRQYKDCPVLAERIIPVLPEAAENMFLARYEALTSRKGPGSSIYASTTDW